MPIAAESSLTHRFSGGAKILNHTQITGLPYDHPNYEVVFAFAEEYHLPILVHTWGVELDHLDTIVGKYPHVNWLLAHTGSQDTEKYIRTANTHDNVYLETCFSRSPRGLIERLVAEVALERIIWGSDQTFLSVTPQIGRVLTAQITADQKRAILGQNAKQALNMEV